MAAAVVSMTGTIVRVTTPTLVVVTGEGIFDTTVISGRYGLKLDDLDALTSTVLYIVLYRVLCEVTGTTEIVEAS